MPKLLSRLLWLIVVVLIINEAYHLAASRGKQQAPSDRAVQATNALDTQSLRGESDASSNSPEAKPAPGERLPAAVITQLNEIPVKGRAPKTGYDRREQFGSGWKDPDHNGCDARNDALAAALGDLRISGRCKVLSGTLVSAYSGEPLSFVRGNTTSFEVQIDHVVALSDAWQKGAQHITYDDRVLLANDPINLEPVEQRLNAQKSDSDAASWLPPKKSYRCTYVARQIAVKHTYRLWVTQAERDAMLRVLQACPDQPALASELRPMRIGD